MKNSQEEIGEEADTETEARRINKALVEKFAGEFRIPNGAQYAFMAMCNRADNCERTKKCSVSVFSDEGKKVGRYLGQVGHSIASKKLQRKIHVRDGEIIFFAREPEEKLRKAM